MKKQILLLCMCISFVLCMLASAAEKKPLNEIFTNGAFTTFNASFNINDPASFTIHPLSDEGQEPDIPYQAGEWINIMTEGFEGSWPTGLWGTSGNPTWGVDDFKPHTGSYSLWCARGGTLGRDPAVNYQYVNNMDALAPYGPFDLTGATDAELNFYHWTDCEYNYDAFVWFASLDGINYYGDGYTGNGNGWLYQSFDLTNVYTIGDVTGDASVWIAFYFYSDYIVTDYGTFVDDVVLRKYMDDTPPPPPEDEGDGRDSWVDADDYLHIPMTVAPPVIDGELDLEWYSTPVIKLLQNTAMDPINPVDMIPDDYLDATMEARAMWDNDYFYFFGKFIDDYPGEVGAEPWNNDSFELYFDGDNSKNGIGPLSGDDVQWRWVYGETSGNPSAGGEEIAWSDTDYGYNFEMRIPASALTFPLVENHEIGFEIQNNDRDAGIFGHRLKWWSTDNNSWQQPDIWGSAILDPAQASDILPCYSTDTPPVIDGVADAMWDAFPLFPTNCWLGGSGPFDFEAFDSYFDDNWVDFRIAWDADNFYGILYIRDEVNANPTVDCWNNDSVEIYWDGDNADSNPYDDNDTQARFGSDGTIEDNTGIFIPACNSNISLGGNRTGSDGYWVEFSVPWTGLNFTGINGNLFGFEVQANDNDNEGIDNSRESQARWWSDDNESWIDAGLFGTARFIGDETPPPPYDIEVSILEDWNLLGLPCAVADASYQTLFPNAVDNTCYGWNGSYTPETDFVAGEGRWLRFPDSETVTIDGTAITELTINLSDGWNMISGISQSVGLSAVSDPSGIIIPGTLYGFSGSYFGAISIDPGNGYWLRANGDGQIQLGGAAKQVAVERMTQTDLSLYPSLNIEDARGASQGLYFNVKLDKEDNLSMFGLPPVSPAGFDARFSGDMRISQTDEAVIEIKASAYPIRITAHNLPLDHQYELQGKGSKEILALANDQTIEITDRSLNRFELTKIAMIPAVFTVSQNYPNPFNPTTEIQYGLPVSQHVSITIFNALGQKVKTLVFEEQQAGMHTVTWDATSDAGSRVGSGIYYYWVKAGEKSERRKMLLLK